jgi:hypothetical protein
LGVGCAWGVIYIHIFSNALIWSRQRAFDKIQCARKLYHRREVPRRLGCRLCGVVEYCMCDRLAQAADPRLSLDVGGHGDIRHVYACCHRGKKWTACVCEWFVRRRPLHD